MRNASLIAAFAASVAVPAFAGNLDPAPAEAPVVAPAPVIVPTGTDWTGPYVGAQLGYGFGDADDNDLDGIIGGLQAGYNYDFGNVVIGGEIDYNLADLSIDGGGTVDQVGRLKAKLGYDAGRFLPYVTAGGAYANIDPDAGDSLSDFGWTAGVGIDYLVTDRITAGVEYLYHQFNDFDDTGVDATVNTIAAKVNYRF